MVVGLDSGPLALARMISSKLGEKKSTREGKRTCWTQTVASNQTEKLILQFTGGTSSAKVQMPPNPDAVVQAQLWQTPQFHGFLPQLPDQFP